VLAEVGGGDNRTAGFRDGRGVFERARSLAVRFARRQCKVTSPPHRVVDDVAEESMNAPPVFGRAGLIEG